MFYRDKKRYSKHRWMDIVIKAIILAWTMKISFPIKSEHKKEWKEIDSKQRS